jgi:hypothetical protein
MNIRSFNSRRLRTLKKREEHINKKEDVKTNELEIKH